MKQEWIIEKVTYIKKHNMVKYKVIKRFFWAETAITYLNINKNKAIQLSNTGSLNTEHPIFIVTDKAQKELKRVKD